MMKVHCRGSPPTVDLPVPIHLGGERCCWSTVSCYLTLGVANGKIRDSPRRRDPCLKIQDRDLKASTKSDPETLYQENQAQDFILRKSEPVSKTFAARHDNELHDIQ